MSPKRVPLRKSRSNALSSPSTNHSAFTSATTPSTSTISPTKSKSSSSIPTTPSSSVATKRFLSAPSPASSTPFASPASPTSVSSRSPLPSAPKRVKLSHAVRRHQLANFLRPQPQTLFHLFPPSSRGLDRRLASRHLHSTQQRPLGRNRRR